MWWWPDRGPRWTSWLSQPSCSFLQWGERLYRVKTPPLSARHGPPVLTSAPHVHPAAHSTPRRRDLTQTCYMLCALQRGRASFQCSDGENNQTHTHTQEFFIPPVFTPLHSKLSFPIYCYGCCYRCCFFLFSSSESNKDEWTLDGLLKLCKCKSQTNVLLLFMFVAFSPGIGEDTFSRSVF